MTHEMEGNPRRRPLLLDMFCGAGGGAVGYHRAGFDVVGVDNVFQPRYPFPFVQGDALRPPFNLSDFDAIHASPPCQKFSTLAALHKDRNRVDLIPQARDLLNKSGLPWVIENVPGAPLRFATMLCASSFGLGTFCADGKFHQLRRHRIFESSFLIMSPPCNHVGRPIGVYGHGGGDASRGHRKGLNGFTGKASERREAMGIDWMIRSELSQAIPPAYCEFIGKQLLRHLEK